MRKVLVWTCLPQPVDYVVRAQAAAQDRTVPDLLRGIVAGWAREQPEWALAAQPAPEKRRPLRSHGRLRRTRRRVEE